MGFNSAFKGLSAKLFLARPRAAI